MSANRWRWIASLVLMLGSVSSTAHAEQGCPEGFMPNAAGTPGVPCIPGMAQKWDYGESQQPSVNWATRWGAIAMDNASGKTGIAGSMSSKRKAEKGALAQCKAKGGGNCQVKLAYHNQCGVLAWGGGGMSVANAPTVDEASELAMKECSKDSSECKVYFSGCSYAERTR